MIDWTDKMVCVHKECKQIIFCLTYTNTLIWKYVIEQIM